ncbi:hypothetical protein [Fimbriiglobus ruber]|uniref:Phage protein n=1 Tax=Fimbriiglobus ruber TaxID=1908690 RepID=A0A225DL26_9BACT|nr:hypothetical protein [Fimbriiglobus ruber]OWK42190.1 Phage protein [Fimbriiglobus ruber]
MHHIYSTLANNNEYIRYTNNGPGGVNIAERSVVIKGGHGIHKKGIGTAMGVHTTVSDEDFEWLKDDYSFKQHMKNGYIQVKKGEVNTEVAAADMVTRDQRTDACPIVPQDFKDDGKKETVKPAEGKKPKAA